MDKKNASNAINLNRKLSLYEKETVEKIYSNIYDKVNLILDELRNIVLLQNTKNLVKVTLH